MIESNRTNSREIAIHVLQRVRQARPVQRLSTAVQGVGNNHQLKELHKLFPHSYSMASVQGTFSVYKNSTRPYAQHPPATTVSAGILNILEISRK